jgi:hypothetical protein
MLLFHLTLAGCANPKPKHLLALVPWTCTTRLVPIQLPEDYATTTRSAHSVLRVDGVEIQYRCAI